VRLTHVELVITRKTYEQEHSLCKYKPTALESKATLSHIIIRDKIE
jgi:hypothetical protein